MGGHLSSVTKVHTINSVPALLSSLQVHLKPVVFFKACLEGCETFCTRVNNFGSTQLAPLTHLSLITYYASPTILSIWLINFFNGMM